MLTSLLEPKKYPAEELVALYHERWEIETGYGEIKTTLLDRRETLSSRNVESVHLEIGGVLLAYSIIAKPGAPPKGGQRMRERARLILPERRERSYPRGDRVLGSRHPPISRARRGLKT